LRERVLAIVTLIAQYVMEDRDPLTESDLVEELLAVGFADVQPARRPPVPPSSEDFHP